MKCENADRCRVKNCPHHKKDHVKMTGPDNDCEAQCDVIDGLKGSKCFEGSRS